MVIVIDRIARQIPRWRYIYMWRLRYWLMDKPEGLRFRVIGAVVLATAAMLIFSITFVVALKRWGAL